VQDRATVSALAMAIMQEETLPASYLYIALGEEIGACLVLDGEPRLAQRGEAGRFGAALVREAGSGEMRPLDRLAGYAALRATLAADGFEATDEDALYRAVHERAGLVESWSRAAGEALFLAVQPLHAGLGLGAVILCTAPPKSIGDRIFDSFRAGFAEAAKTSAAAPALRRDEPPTGAQAMRAAGLALYERFSPRLRGLTRRDEDATAEDEA
jgi:predicted NBD/HSP70 family sugar kinase